MIIELDVPLDFDPVRCEVCRQEDDDWCVMHFLADGAWRSLERGKTLREDGIDELDTSRLYCIHACVEAGVRRLISVRQIEEFLADLRRAGARSRRSRRGHV